MSPTPSSSISALARVAIMTGLAFSFLPTLGHASAAPMAQRTRTSNALTIARPKARLAAPRLTATTAFSKNPVVSRAPRTRHSLIPKSTMAPGARTFEATKEMKQMDSNSALLDEILTDISLLSKEGELMQRPSVSTVFYTVLSATLLSIVSPWAFPEAITEVLVPTSASIIAVCTTAAEFQGKDATADAKEVAAVATAQAARAEAYLSRAEKAKAIMPAMVGTSATAATLCLIFPALMAGGAAVNPLFVTLCPIISTAAAAWGAAALKETEAQGQLALGKVDSDRIISVREASTPELKEKAFKQRLNSILRVTVPSILIGFLMPGDFIFKAIVSSAVAAVATAYNLAEAETVTAEVTLKVAFIAKSAAQADVFANKAAAESSLLPFTSALAGVGVALAAAMVEIQPVVAGFLPLFGAVASGVATAAGTRAEMDATSTRLAFRDSGIRKVAPPATIPNLFANVVPELFQAALVRGFEISLDSAKQAIGLNVSNSNAAAAVPKTYDTQLKPPSSAAGARVVGASGISGRGSNPAVIDEVSMSYEPMISQSEKLSKRQRLRRFFSKRLGRDSSAVKEQRELLSKLES
ncbi:hypothetical protein AAMO2058_001393300 [Amorphochlora amoebiformis]